jgi:hypothetical protein
VYRRPRRGDFANALRPPASLCPPKMLDPLRHGQALRPGQRALRNRTVTIAGPSEEQRAEQKNRKKIKEVLTRFRHLGYKRRFILKFKLHFTTAHEKEIHFAIRVF